MATDALPPAEVRVGRGELVESRHRVLVAVVDVDGDPVASAGDVSGRAFYRSAAKPFQALPLVEDGVADALGLTGSELALCCASHNGEPRHLEGARSILRKAGLGEDALACGPHAPIGEDEARRLAAAGTPPAPIHNNCSGKHAGMLALAVHRGWPTDGYHEPSHPVQRRMLDEIERWSGVPRAAIGTGVDGCGVVCFAVPLRAVARSFARLGRAEVEGREGAARIVGAMARWPEMLAGSGRLNTALVEAAGDRVVAKTGAEGVYGALVRSGPRRGLGIAVKVEDGARRAAGVALLRVLHRLGVLTRSELEGPLAPFHRPQVRNTRGDVVGRIEADFELEASPGPGG